MTTYVMLDMTPKGRNEQNNMTDWVRPHDRYGVPGHVDGIGQFHEEAHEEGHEKANSCCGGK